MLRRTEDVLVIEDRDALEVLTSACGQSVRLADRAFGPEIPSPVYKPRSRRAK